jgi:hypothetical protein
MEDVHCTTHETHIAHANSVAREIYLNYSPEKQNKFIRQLLKELTEKRQDGIHAAMKDIQFLSVNMRTSIIQYVHFERKLSITKK